MLFVGFANQMHGVEWGGSVMVLGFSITVFMMFGCFIMCIEGVWLCYGYLRGVVMLWVLRGCGYVIGI
jgi:hypothetical protein